MPRKHGSYTCRHGSKATSHAYSHITSFVEKYVPRLPLRGRLQLDRDCHCIEILAAKAPHLQDEVPIPRAATYSGCLNVPGPVGGGWGGSCIQYPIASISVGSLSVGSSRWGVESPIAFAQARNRGTPRKGS